MRLVLQRVSSASVSVDGSVVAAIGPGLVVLAGVGPSDTPAAAERLAGKVAALRIFPDGGGKMNVSVLDAAGSCLVVSQFTLYGDARKGTRPSFAGAARPELAVPVLSAFAGALRGVGVPVEEGVFGAHMEVALVNDGPVTILMEG
ncbi:MAG TPA: D-aminoacyl-tRNA deacylase [Actinomycetota bacterium]|nr:D-aminoacyl-tRNA deacylase [Actinomycetota bacterium]